METAKQDVYSLRQIKDDFDKFYAAMSIDFDNFISFLSNRIDTFLMDPVKP